MRKMRQWFWSLMVLSMGVAMGQQTLANVVITFSDEDAWDGGTMGSYNAKTYDEDGWLFAAGDAVRETTEARRIGTYGWRLRESVWVAENTETATYTGFEIRVRPWGTGEPNAANPFSLEYSTDGGDEWTLVSDNIIGNDPLDWIIFSESFAAAEFEEGEFQVRLSATPAATQRLNVGQFTAFSPEPSLTPEPLSLSGFTYLEDSGPSEEQSYTLSGMNLEGTGNILVSASGGFEVSLTSGGGFGGTVNVPFADEQITGQPVTIYVRLSSGLGAGTHSGTIGHTGGGVTESVNVAVAGEVIPAPPAGTLAYYTFTSQSIAPDFVAADITAEDFAISAGTLGFGTANAADWTALGASVPYAQGSTGYDAADQATAKNFFVELNADPGKAITITNIYFVQRRTGAGPTMVGIRINDASVYADSLADATVVAVDQAVTGFGNLESAVIRIDGWAGGGGNHRVDNVIIQGFVDDAVAADIPPIVTTPTATDIVGGSATLGGTIVDEGDATVVERGIIWSLDEEFDPETEGTTVSEAGSFGEGAFTIAVTDMPPVSTVYFYAFARNAAGSGFSGRGQFDTLATAPVVDSPSVANVMTTSATLGGTVVATGGQQVVDIGVIYSDDPEFDPDTEGVTVTDTGDFAPGAYTFEVAGLDPATEYTFVFFAVNLTGQTYSEKASFTTMAPPPADLLAYYTFDGDSADATFSDPEVTASELTVSAGSFTFEWVGTHAAAWEALGGAEPYVQSVGGWANELREEAKYFEIVLTADTSMTITNVSFLQRRTTAGPDTTGVSINGTSVYEDELADATVVAVNIPVTGFVDVETATIRVEGWGTTTGTGQLRLDNLLVQGTVGDDPGPDPDPEPADISFTGVFEPGTSVSILISNSEVGRNYVLQYTTDLVDPDWTTVDALGGTGGDLTLTDEDFDDDDEMRIYRVVNDDPI